MPVKEDFSTYTHTDENGDLTVTAELLTFATWATRDHRLFGHKDKGVNAIADGYSYDMYFNYSAFANNAYAFPFGSANIAGAYIPTIRGSALDGLNVFLNQNNSAVRRIVIIHDYAVGLTEFSSINFPYITPNAYRLNISRSGQSVIITLYDQSGGHGPQFAIVHTDTLTCAQVLDDHRYLYDTNCLNDNSFVSPLASISGTHGPLWDMNAVPSGVRVFPKARVVEEGISRQTKGGLHA